MKNEEQKTTIIVEGADMINALAEHGSESDNPIIRQLAEEAKAQIRKQIRFYVFFTGKGIRPGGKKKVNFYYNNGEWNRIKEYQFFEYDQRDSHEALIEKYITEIPEYLESITIYWTTTPITVDTMFMNRKTFYRQHGFKEMQLKRQSEEL